MEQTAVSWLENELSKYDIHAPISLSNWDTLKQLVEQAKAIERQKMIDAMMYTFHQQNTLPYGMEYIVKRDEMIENCIKYYNETYGTHK
jgi:hypothetical protein